VAKENITSVATRLRVYLRNRGFDGRRGASWKVWHSSFRNAQTCRSGRELFATRNVRDFLTGFCRPRSLRVLQEIGGGCRCHTLPPLHGQRTIKSPPIYSKKERLTCARARSKVVYTYAECGACSFQGKKKRSPSEGEKGKSKTDRQRGREIGGRASCICAC